MLVPVLLIILGFILLIKGADYLVEASSQIAKRFHIPEIVIGLTIVSIGTSLPELLVSINSATKGFSDMSLGNVIGSNICNLLLILGVSASIRRLKLKRETRYIEVPLCVTNLEVHCSFLSAIAADSTSDPAADISIIFP